MKKKESPNHLLPHYYTDLIEAGCDEAGRGCLAGRVYAAAVILPPDYDNPALNDSKKLSEKRRRELRDQIVRDAVDCAVGIVTPEEIDRVVKFVTDEAGEAHYDQDVIEKIQQAVDAKSDKGAKRGTADAPADGEDGDELLPAAVEVVLETGQASVSMLQRRLKLGYSRAARLVDQMEERGYVGPFEGSKPRQLLITREKWQELHMAKGASPAEPDKPADSYGSINDVFESHDALE